MANLRLTTGQYLRPGAYIGYVFQARPVGASGMPRLPCYVGMGSRLAQTLDLPITRGYLKAQPLSFTTVAPHIATLPYQAMSDKTVATIYTQTGGNTLSSTVWAFRESVSGSGVYDQVEIAITSFDRNASYLINYQTNDRSVRDELLIPEIRQILYAGSAPGEVLYSENVDYRIVTSLVGDTTQTDALLRSTTNSDGLGRVPAAPTATLQAGSTGAVTFNVANAYTYKYSLAYQLECTASGGIAPNRTATFRLTVSHIGGGNSIAHPLPSHPSSLKSYTFTITEGVNNTNFQLASGAGYATLFTDGLRLNFAFGAANFVPEVVGVTPGDLFNWNAIGAQLIEFPASYFNTNQFSVTTLDENGNVNGVDPNHSSGRVELNVDTNYTGTYNRKYLVECISATIPAARAATFAWTGWGETVTTGTITVAEATPTSLTRILLEDGIYLNFEFGARHVAPDAGDQLVSPNATDLASAITLATEFRTKYNVHTTDALVTWHLVGGAAHAVTAAVPTDLATLITMCTDASSKYTAHIDDATQHTVTDDINRLSTHTLTDLAGCISFLNDLKAVFNRHAYAVNFVQGDTYEVVADAAMRWYTGKDDRNYTFTATTVTPGTLLSFQWRTDQWESGWGNVDTTPANPYINLNDYVSAIVRNFDPTGALVQYANGDVFTFAAINDDLIDWSLRRRVTESISASEIKFDTLGRVTGVPLSYYIILNTTPDSIVRVKDASTNLPLSYTWVIGSDGLGTVYINLGLTNPNTIVEVTYEWRGMEPDPSQVYYMSANRLRSDEEYEIPIKHLYRENMNAYLRPGEATNSIWIMGNIAFDTAFFGCFTCQVKSASGDDVYTDSDYKRAVDATESDKDITDLIVLNRYNVMGYSKLSVERMSSPYQGKERLLWQGVPVGTPLGDSQTPNTLVYIAKTTLQFYGNSPGRGRAILLANRWADREVVYDDGTASVLRLDGSYIAGYAAALTASFSTPIETLLRKDCASFQLMDTWGEKEIQILGDASILYMDSVGSGVYRFGESHTVDVGAPDVNEISAMTQKDYVTRRIRTRINDNLIGIIVPSPAAGVVQVQSFLVQELGNLVSEGLVAPYGSENNPPTIRNIDAGTDTFVIVDERDRRKYHIGYWFNIIYPIKWVMGLYSVDSRWWDNRSLASPS